MRRKPSLRSLALVAVLLLCLADIAAAFIQGACPSISLLSQKPSSKGCYPLLHALIDPNKSVVSKNLKNVAADSSPSPDQLCVATRTDDEEPTTESSPETSLEPSRLLQQNNGADWIGGLAWRGVVVVLCALWASNFAAVKLITAEPGEFD